MYDILPLLQRWHTRMQMQTRNLLDRLYNVTLLYYSKTTYRKFNFPVENESTQSALYKHFSQHHLFSVVDDAWNIFCNTWKILTSFICISLVVFLEQGNIICVDFFFTFIIISVEWFFIICLWTVKLSIFQQILKIL